MALSGDASLDSLLVATAGGDRQAFAALYRKTSAKLFGVILRILPEGGRAEDVLQDVYARIWHAAGGYDPARGKPITWLAAIARNRAVDVVRQEIARGGGRTIELDPEQLGELVDETPDAGEITALHRCLGTLDPEHRDCILLAYVQGASRDELAARFARPVGTIKSWLSRGLLALRGCLSDG